MSRINYLLSRFRESPIDKTLLVLFIRLKKIIYELYYDKFFYSLLKPKKISNKFSNLDDFKLDFLKSLKNLQITIPKKIIKDLKENKFDCLGYGKLNFLNDDVWNSDLIHGYKWPYKYFNKIDYVKKNIKCDVKIPWEINRLQFLTIISLQYIDTGDFDLVSQYKKVINNWINVNRPGFGIAWTCNMEVSIRAMNLITSFIIINDEIEPELKEKIKLSILEHYYYIKTFPEISDVPGNHYLSNLSAEYFCAYFIFGSKSLVTERALENFSLEASKQFDSDGCHFENATIYHRLCLDFVAIVLALSSQRKLNKNLFEIFSKGVKFCEKISSDYVLPIIGDADSGKVFWLGNDSRNFKYLSDFNKYLNGQDMPDLISQEYKILIALTGANNFSQKKIVPECFNFIGNISQLSVYKSKKIVLTMRYGKQGMLGRASHDHDDAQNIFVMANGKDLLIDEGCKSYSLDVEVRKKDILSSGHNGLKLLNHERFPIQEGSVINSIKGALTCEETQFSTNSFYSKLKTEHSSQFQKLDRKILFSENSCFQVEDYWECYKNQDLCLMWRFNSENIQNLRNNIDKNKINFQVKNNNHKILVEINSNTKFYTELFDFNYGYKYGTSVNRKGIKIIISNSIKGHISTKFEVL